MIMFAYNGWLMWWYLFGPSLYIAHYHVYGWGLGNNLQSTTLNAIDISRGPYIMSGLL
jgi:hypothetical protein